MSSLYELVELTNGEIALKRADEEFEEPLVTIRFSTESLSVLGRSKFVIAKAMIEAAMEAASEDADEDDEYEQAMFDEEMNEIHQLH